MLAWDQLRPVVLGRVGEEELSASELRGRLDAAGVPLSPLVFRGMLAALERTGLIVGRYAAGGGSGDAEGRRYRLTPAGRVELGVPSLDLREAA